MIPTAGEICSIQIVTTNITSTIDTAIKKMTSSNVRTIVIEDSNSKEYFLLTVDDAIEFKLQNIPLDTPLNKVSLTHIDTIDRKINIIELVRNYKTISEYYLVTSQNEVIGILSQTDIINHTDPKVLVEKQSIGTLIRKYSVVTINEKEPTVEAVKLMKDKKVDSVIVIDSDKKPKGIFTTKDFLNILHNDNNLELEVSQYMSSPLETINENAKVSEVLEFIKVKQFKRVVINDKKGAVIGTITQNELLGVINNKWIKILQVRGEELAKLNEKLIKKATSLEEKASKDYLTNLYNRKKFDTILNYEFTLMKRNPQRNLALIILDIDNFKVINDTYGHDTGDTILIDIAKIIQLSSRESDIVCRWGGEEFTIALPETSIERAYIVAEKIRKSIENFIFHDNLTITASVGVSQFHSNDDYNSFFKRADEAMYTAKHSGKNKVILESI
jgi:diguanylate cyclase